MLLVEGPRDGVDAVVPGIPAPQQTKSIFLRKAFQPFELCNGVVPYSHGLHRNARVEGAQLELDECSSVGVCPLGAKKQLRQIVVFRQRSGHDKVFRFFSGRGRAPEMQKMKLKYYSLN